MNNFLSWIDVADYLEREKKKNTYIDDLIDLHHEGMKVYIDISDKSFREKVFIDLGGENFNLSLYEFIYGRIPKHPVDKKTQFKGEMYFHDGRLCLNKVDIKEVCFTGIELKGKLKLSGSWYNIAGNRSIKYRECLEVHEWNSPEEWFEGVKYSSMVKRCDKIYFLEDDILEANNVGSVTQKNIEIEMLKKELDKTRSKLKVLDKENKRIKKYNSKKIASDHTLYKLIGFMLLLMEVRKICSGADILRAIEELKDASKENLQINNMAPSTVKTMFTTSRKIFNEVCQQEKIKKFFKINTLHK